ncbi:MAG TPA: flagellar protein FlgN, partial [Clostridia bacterium]|nr:flagellar protein FlgN [Clostridia bacterium]
EQLPLYTEMLNIVKGQEECLLGEEVDLEKLNRLINRRREIMDKLISVNEALTKLKEELEKEPAFNGQDYIKYLELNSREFLTVKQDLKKLMGEIKELDEKNGQLLQVKINEIRRNLKKVREDKRAINLYGGYSNHQQAAFFDRNA